MSRNDYIAQREDRANEEKRESRLFKVFGLIVISYYSGYIIF